ncbi:unnamed protein product [Cuscuta epithymum]|uniref:Uncharacterized protein n=1 Tax=Cuscuta epithymum TaxID=186058 RepID=A0AAV0DIJ7_9ASTE|nr:unnamed protein product [Cuscuta epithymum]
MSFSSEHELNDMVVYGVGPPNDLPGHDVLLDNARGCEHFTSDHFMEKIPIYLPPPVMYSLRGAIHLMRRRHENDHGLGRFGDRWVTIPNPPISSFKSSSAMKWSPSSPCPTLTGWWTASSYGARRTKWT